MTAAIILGVIATYALVIGVYRGGRCDGNPRAPRKGTYPDLCYPI